MLSRADLSISFPAIRVRDVSEQELLELSHLAARQLSARAVVHVVAIAHGGAVIGRHISRELASMGVAHAYWEAKCQRPSTGKKRAQFVVGLLARLPRVVTNWLRRAESVIGYYRRRQTEDPRDVLWLDPAAPDALNGTRDLVLVLDDAVDSGATLAAVCSELRSLAPEAPLLTVAFTVTQPRPMMLPDFAFYRGVLLRFPWALDAKR